MERSEALAAGAQARGDGGWNCRGHVQRGAEGAAKGRGESRGGGRAASTEESGSCPNSSEEVAPSAVVRPQEKWPGEGSGQRGWTVRSLS